MATGLLPEEKVSEIRKECDEIAAILTTIVKKLKNKVKGENGKGKSKAGNETIS